MGLPAGLAADVRSRVLAKLITEPVEDLRLDFEDGYGDRGDDAEDADARRAAAALAAEAAAGGPAAPPFTGLRCKSLEPSTRRRAIRTLDAFLGALLAGGPLPPGFVITLPKVTSADQVTAMARLCRVAGTGARPGIRGAGLRGAGGDPAADPRRGRRGHRGPVRARRRGPADRAALRHLRLQRRARDRGPAAEPGAPGGRPRPGGDAGGGGRAPGSGSATARRTCCPRAAGIRSSAAWERHARLVRRSLDRGFYQGWDMHPAQLASRYAATFGFFREGLPAAAARLRGYVGRRAAGPDQAETVLEEPATARALAGLPAPRPGLRRGHRARARRADRPGPVRPRCPRLARPGP